MATPTVVTLSSLREEVKELSKNAKLLTSVRKLVSCSIECHNIRTMIELQSEIKDLNSNDK